MLIDCFLSEMAGFEKYSSRIHPRTYWDFEKHSALEVINIRRVRMFCCTSIEYVIYCHFRTVLQFVSHQSSETLKVVLY